MHNTSTHMPIQWLQNIYVQLKPVRFLRGLLQIFFYKNKNTSAVKPVYNGHCGFGGGNNRNGSDCLKASNLCHTFDAFTTISIISSVQVLFCQFCCSQAQVFTHIQWFIYSLYTFDTYSYYTSVHYNLHCAILLYQNVAFLYTNYIYL